MYIYNNRYVLCFLVDCLLAGQHVSIVEYTVYLLMMGYKYARNM